MIIPCISSIATAASILSLALSTDMPLPARIALVVFSMACLALLLHDNVKQHSVNERICRSEDEIKETMKTLVKTQGKVCIMSRALTWVDAEVEACIASKGRSIIIFAENENELTKRLIEKGVVVKYYGTLGFQPLTRFTVIQYNRTDPQVAISNRKNSIRKNKRFRHVIYETGGGNCKQDQWITSLAVDMINLCIKVFNEET